MNNNSDNDDKITDLGDNMIMIKGMRFINYTAPPKRNLVLVVTKSKGDQRVGRLIEEVYRIMFPGRTRIIELSLSSGDFEFRDELTGEPYLACVERKSMADFSSTIGSERDMQLAQMHHTGRHGIFVISGDPMDLPTDQKRKAAYSRMNTYGPKWDKTVYLTQSDKFTAQSIIGLHLSLEHLDEKKHFQSFDFMNKNILVGHKEKRQLTEESAMHNMLTLAYSISSEKAHSIARVYPSHKDLISAYMRRMRNGGDPDTMLADVPHAAGNSSKLGPASSKAISDLFNIRELYRSLYPSDGDDVPEANDVTPKKTETTVKPPILFKRAKPDAAKDMFSETTPTKTPIVFKRAKPNETDIFSGTVEEIELPPLVRKDRSVPPIPSTLIPSIGNDFASLIRNNLAKK